MAEYRGSFSAGASLLVTPEQLYEKSQSLATGLRKIKSGFEIMEKKMIHTSAYWNGEASDAYRRTYIQYKGEIEEILGRLKEHADDLNKMAGVYERAEAAVKETTQTLPSDVIV